MEKRIAIVDRKSALSGLTVREAMRRLNCYLDRNASIRQAIRQTIKCKVNAVLILNENNEAIGVVSKTNIMGAYYAGLPITTSLDAIMVSPPLLCHLDDSLDLALDTMRNSGVHRLYVVAEEPKKVVGILTYPYILGVLYRYCHKCERSTVRMIDSGSADKLADHFRVCELMNSTFQVHGEDDSLIHVMESISDSRSMSALITGGDGLPRGVVSSTDLIIAYMHGVPFDAAAKAIMSTPVCSCEYYEPLLLAVKKMIFHDFDSLYVHKETPTNIVGVVTLADLARVRSGSCRACDQPH